MEISKLTGNSLRIKGKKSTFLVDVTDIKKTEANGYVFLKEDAKKVGYVKDAMIMTGSGDYEVSGTKISSSRYNDALFYEFLIDDIKILLANASKLSSVKDKINEQNILLLFADEVIDQSAITNFSPVVVIAYGEKATELSAQMGKGLSKKDEEGASPDAEIKPTDKYTITFEKLPTELQVVLLS